MYCHCGVGFSRLDHLRRHESTVHIGARNYSCPDCDKRFGRSCHLRRHAAVAHRRGGACAHGRARYQCADCQSFLCDFCEPTRRFSSANRLRDHMARFHADQPKALTKRRELDVYRALVEAGVEFEYQYHVPFDGLGCRGARAFVDFRVRRPWGSILLEVDEDQHRSYPCDCCRDVDLFAALGAQEKILILRYNPDPFKIAGVTLRTTQKERIARLLAVLEQEPAGSARWFLFYTKDRPEDELPSVAAEWEQCVKDISRAL